VTNAVVFAAMGFTLMPFIQEQAPCRKQDFLVINTLMIKATKNKACSRNTSIINALRLKAYHAYDISYDRWPRSIRQG
jgi:hypothetical protein